MRFNYNNYPCLKYLTDKKIGKMPLLDVDIESGQHTDIWVRLGDMFKRDAEKYSQKIYYITEPFYMALEKSANSLYELMADILKNDIGDIVFSGTFIYRNQVIFCNCNAIKGVEYFERSWVVFHKNGAPLNFYYSNKETFGWASNSYDLKNEGSNMEKFFASEFSRIAVLNLFLKYANVETNEVCKNKKILVGNEKHLNETDFPVTILNSTWFTNIIRNESFGVRGHFRLQPKKVNGEWTKELIWIKDFEKKGYSRKATLAK